MKTRANFDHNLQQLKESLLQMSAKSELAIKDSMVALLNQDLDLAHKVIQSDNDIDQMEQDIHDKALMLIARESPVAKDLRKISVALKVSSEVERMGDMAVNIAKSVIRIGNQTYLSPLKDISKMMESVVEMVTDSITAYYAEDIDLAQKCAKKDDQVDEMFGVIIGELLSQIPSNPNSMNQIIQLSFVCRFLERIADHSTNIVENVIFLETGKLYNLNA
ncbi:MULTISPECIES: phosphate signaling complex protein PhoU [Bacillaceae]|uniref:phosphate signaling complex protein PhoU n=1 Tax=Bacillaceae TaxID=186817 RepID=UPI002FFED6BE